MPAGDLRLPGGALVEQLLDEGEVRGGESERDLGGARAQSITTSARAKDSA
ncbi:hypothetical protein [Streptomyces neyagawaensis]|uniref:hypothetical protein n=1 Tax=Streptomyces neyagawaensis TaxID=42238 RepID=UPI003F4CC3E4